MTASCHTPAEPAATSALHSAQGRLLLVGRPNSGKSSLFNALTNGHARVGNYPGVTVDILERDLELPGGETIRVVDLPGTYTLDVEVDADSDEGVARSYIATARDGPGSVLLAQVLDPSNLGAGLRLTKELLRLRLPLLLVLSHRDVFEAEGLTVDLDVLRRATGCPVVWVSARFAEARVAVLAAAGQSLRSSATRAEAMVALSFDPDVVAREALAANRGGGSALHTASGSIALQRRTDRLDRVLMHAVAGPVIFFGAIALLFTAVFVVADPISAVVARGLDACSAIVRSVLGEGRMTSFVCSGLIGGAGTVLQFLPQIVLLTLALAVIEASGYLARGAYLTDRLLRVAGLGGRSFVPLLMAHGCAVPAIAATRTIRDPRHRLKTMLVLPLMTCSARIPVYGLIIATFFPRLGPIGRAAVFLLVYALALLSSGLASIVIDRTVMKNRRLLPLVLELPAYRLPQLRALAALAWRTSVRFVRDVGTVIVLISALLWALLSLPMPRFGLMHGEAAPTRDASGTVSRSIAAGLGRALEPVTHPLGFDWRMNVALIGAFGARETVVSTMGVIYGLEESGSVGPSALPSRMRAAVGTDGRPAYSVATGLSLIAFFLLACQCASTVAALRRETRGWRWPLFVVGYSYSAAYLLALVVHTAASFGS